MTRALPLLAAWAALAGALVARAGLYPAVMTGDEIWFAESAWQYLRDGVPHRMIHAGALGSAVADFLPPIVMLIQAGAFALLGITAQAVAAQSVLAPLGLMILTFLAARAAGAPLRWAGLASLGVLGSQLVLRAGLYIRYEALVALLFLAHVAATRMAQTARLAWPWHLLRGLTLCLAGLAYYPTAPFVAFAALLLDRPARDGWRDVLALRRLLPLTLGFALPAAGFLAYVAEFPAEFAAQVLSNGGGNYLVFELPRRLFDPDLWRQSRDALPELLGLLVFFAVALRRRRDAPAWERGLVAAALVCALPLLLYPFQLRLLAVTVTLVLLVLAGWATTAAGRLRTVARAALALGALAAALNGVLMVATARLQEAGRRYETAVTEPLARLLTLPGPAAIDQRAWLALRTADPERLLLHVIPGGAAAQVRVFEPARLRDPDGGEDLRYVVLYAPEAERTIRDTPALARAFAAGRFTEIGRVRPDFRPLPWATQPPYDLVVYARPD